MICNQVLHIILELEIKGAWACSFSMAKEVWKDGHLGLLSYAGFGCPFQLPLGLCLRLCSTLPWNFPTLSPPLCSCHSSTYNSYPPPSSTFPAYLNSIYSSRLSFKTSSVTIPDQFSRHICL